MKKTLFALASLIVLVAVTWGVLTLISGGATSQSDEESQASVVPSIPEISPTANPLEGEIPEVSPTENTNPFSDKYTNPFK